MRLGGAGGAVRGFDLRDLIDGLAGRPAAALVRRRRVAAGSRRGPVAVAGRRPVAAGLPRQVAAEPAGERPAFDPHVAVPLGAGSRACPATVTWTAAAGNVDGTPAAPPITTTPAVAAGFLGTTLMIASQGRLSSTWSMVRPNTLSAMRRLLCEPRTMTSERRAMASSTIALPADRAVTMTGMSFTPNMSAACAARSSTRPARARSSGRFALMGRLSGTSITYSTTIDELRSVASWQASTIISSHTSLSRTGTRSWS